MKVTFQLPQPLVQQLRAHIPSGERSRFVAESISKRLQRQRSALENAAKKANRVGSVREDMKDWEALNGTKAGSLRVKDLAVVRAAVKVVLQLP